jgi:hypothetical protein
MFLVGVVGGAERPKRINSIARGICRRCCTFMCQVEIRNGASVHTDWHNRNPERFLVENHRYSVYVGLPLIAVGLFTPIPLNQRTEGTGQEMAR